MSGKDIPIGFMEQVSGYGSLHSVVVEPPAEGHVYVVRGLWIAVEPYHIVLESLHLGDPSGTKNLLPRPTDVASFNAAPRQDGLPRHVHLPLGELTSTRKLVMGVRPFSTPSIDPWLVGHVVARWDRGPA